MSEYIPDTWVVLEFESEHGKIQKVLSGWSGGYLDGDSWKLSSGITETEETDTEYIFTNYSGSVYHCRKSSREFNMMTSGVYNSYKEQLEGHETATMKIVDFERE